MKSEAKVVLAVAAALLAMELVARPFEPRLSLDLAHIRGFDQLAERVGKASNGGEEASPVLVLGNSLARNGVDAEVLTEGLRDAGMKEPRLVFMTADSTDIAQWLYGYRRYLDGPGAKPALVLLFTARSHLSDRRIQGPEAMGAYYVANGDVQSFLREDAGSLDSACSFLLGRVSRLFAARGRVRPLLFYNWVPGYEVAARQINQGLGDGALADEPPAHGSGEEVGEVGEVQPGGEKSAQSFHRLERLIETVRESGVKLVIVTVPLPEPYRMPEAIREICRKNEVPISLVGESAWLPDGRFPDGYHLNPEGAAEFMEALSSELKGMLSE